MMGGNVFHTNRKCRVVGYCLLQGALAARVDSRTKKAVWHRVGLSVCSGAPKRIYCGTR